MLLLTLEGSYHPYFQVRTLRAEGSGNCPRSRTAWQFGSWNTRPELLALLPGTVQTGEGVTVRRCWVTSSPPHPCQCPSAQSVLDEMWNDVAFSFKGQKSTTPRCSGMGTLGIDWSKISGFCGIWGALPRELNAPAGFKEKRNLWVASARHLCAVLCIILLLSPRLTCRIPLNFIAQAGGSQATWLLLQLDYKASPCCIAGPRVLPIPHLSMRCSALLQSFGPGAQTCAQVILCFSHQQGGTFVNILLILRGGQNVAAPQKTRLYRMSKKAGTWFELLCRL